MMGRAGVWAGRSRGHHRYRRYICHLHRDRVPRRSFAARSYHHAKCGRARLHRRVTIGTIRFNPYTLRLSADALHISERGGTGDFAAVGQIRLMASWSSLYRLAPIIQEPTISAPALNIVRDRTQVFNFADLIETPASPPSSGRALRFAVSNIRLNGGQVHFDDQTLNEHHRVEQIQIGLPFIANMPANTGIFVKPLLQMVVDGSPLRFVGIALPFASTPEYVLNFTIKALDLACIGTYLGHMLPIKIPRGSLSSSLQLRFMQAASEPMIRIIGTIIWRGWTCMMFRIHQWSA
jgi:hypothetical protein